MFHEVLKRMVERYKSIELVPPCIDDKLQCLMAIYQLVYTHRQIINAHLSKSDSWLSTMRSLAVESKGDLYSKALKEFLSTIAKIIVVAGKAGEQYFTNPNYFDSLYGPDQSDFPTTLDVFERRMARMSFDAMEQQVQQDGLKGVLSGNAATLIALNAAAFIFTGPVGLAVTAAGSTAYTTQALAPEVNNAAQKIAGQRDAAMRAHATWYSDLDAILSKPTMTQCFTDLANDAQSQATTNSNANQNK